MGEEMGTAYHLLWNECALLHQRWEEYVEMFGESQAEFDIMNEFAPRFFKAVQDMAWEHILLHLCRFADPAIVSYRQTLSLDSLLKMERSSKVPRIRELIDAAKESVKFAQDWRNRSIAHKDLKHALDSTAKPLAHASRLQVREALAAIVAVLSAVDTTFTGVDVLFDGIGGRGGGGASLLSELRLLSRLRQEREDRLALGTSTADDLDFKKWL